jgi:hypothetical protein
MFNRYWNGVPDGTELEVSLSGGPGYGLAGEYTLRRPSEQSSTRRLGSADFPLRAIIRSDEEHVIEFDIAFTGVPLDLRIDAKLMKDGNRLGNAEAEPFRLDQATSPVAARITANGER